MKFAWALWPAAAAILVWVLIAAAVIGTIVFVVHFLGGG